MSIDAGHARIERPIFLVGPPRSGSRVVFDALGAIDGVTRVATEHHDLFDGLGGRESDRLDARDVAEATIAVAHRRLAESLERDPLDGAPVRPVDRTPKHSLRIPFLAAAFPDAKFVYVYRDPRESISSMLDAWRSERFVTHPDLPGWSGPPWSLVLVPGWRDLIGRPLAEIVAQQWTTTVDLLLDDLERLAPDRWCVASYDRLVDAPDLELQRVCEFLDLPFESNVRDVGPDVARVSSPNPVIWLHNADEIDSEVAVFAPAAERAAQMFASTPRTEPVTTAVASIADSRVSRRRGAAGIDVRPVVEARHDLGMHELLTQLGVSLAVTTGSSNALVLFRATPEGIGVHARAVESPVAIACDGARLAVGLRNEILFFQDQPTFTSRLVPEGVHDGCFVLRRRHLTGEIELNGLSWSDDDLWMTATRFSCLATLDDEHSFVPRWRPGFISDLAADDRCHLTGVAMVDGQPRYVTVWGMTDAPGGWRDGRADGGAILEVPSGAPVVTGLALPHSPRWRGGRILVVESAIGALTAIDPNSGAREEIARVPGWARGLVLVGDHAFVGLSQRRDPAFDDLGATSPDAMRCGVQAVDLTTGAIVGRIGFGAAVREVTDLAVLPLRFPEVVEPGAPLLDSAYVLPGSPAPPLG